MRDVPSSKLALLADRTLESVALSSKSRMRDEYSSYWPNSTASIFATCRPEASPLLCLGGLDALTSTGHKNRTHAEAVRTHLQMNCKDTMYSMRQVLTQTYQLGATGL